MCVSEMFMPMISVYIRMNGVLRIQFLTTYRRRSDADLARAARSGRCAALQTTLRSTVRGSQVCTGGPERRGGGLR